MTLLHTSHNRRRRSAQRHVTRTRRATPVSSLRNRRAVRSARRNHRSSGHWTRTRTRTRKGGTILETGSYSTNSSSSSSSHKGTSHENQKKRPSKSQREDAAQELGHLGFTHLKELGKGAYGFVYKAIYKDKDTNEEHTVALKMVLTSKHQSLKEKSAHIRKLFRRAALYGVSPENMPSANEVIKEPESQYYVEDHVLCLKDNPDITCHLMEFIPGKDLLEYMTAFEKQLYRKRSQSASSSSSSSNTGAPTKFIKTLEMDRQIVPKPDYSEFFKQMCSLVRAVRFLDRARVVFNDLKLENVICFKSGVVLIDYIDSASNCSKLKCEEGTEDTISTYNDTVNDTPSLAEDVFRLALIILDSMMQLLSDRYENGYPAEQITKAMKENPHTFPTAQVNSIIEECVTRTAGEFAEMTDDVQSKFNTTLKAMLHKDPQERPSASELLEDETYVFCGQGNSPDLDESRIKAKQSIMYIRNALRRNSEM